MLFETSATFLCNNFLSESNILENSYQQRPKSQPCVAYKSVAYKKKCVLPVIKGEIKKEAPFQLILMFYHCLLSFASLLPPWSLVTGLQSNNILGGMSPGSLPLAGLDIFSI